MDKLAESLYEAHQNPIVRFNITGKANKIYLPKDTEEEKSLASSNIETLKKIIDFCRVDRRCGRSLAVWVDDKHLAKVIKQRYHNYGFQDKSGIYLYPEEALFLLETNKLEIQWKNIPISIEQGYSLIIKDDILSLDKYKVYKKLALQGYKISKTKKLVHNCDGEPKRKKIKLTDENDTDLMPNDQLDIVESETTNENRQHLKDYDYKIRTSKKGDFHKVHIIDKSELDPKICQLENGSENLYAISTPDNVAFYKFAKVSIPDISNEEFN